MLSKVEVECQSSHYVALINAIRSNNIEVVNITADTDSVKFTIALKHYKSVKEIASGIGYEVHIVKSFGLKNIQLKILKNLGFLMGIIVGLTGAFIMSQFLMVINVDCDTPGFKYEIEKLLKDNHIQTFLLKKSINTDKVENLILSSLEEATFVSVYKKGFSLQVVVQSRENPIVEEATSSLVSTNDGIITRVVLSSGTALVKANDSVKKGQELVAGRFNLLDTAGQPTGEIVPCDAKAEVYAKVYYSGQFYLPDFVMENKKSDTGVVLRELYFGKTLIGKRHKVPFERYECVIGEVKMNAILPFTVKTYTYYNISEKRIEKEEYKERVMYRFREEVFNSMPIGSIVLNDWSEITKIDNMEMLNIHFEVEQRIDIAV